ncbi:alpha/beta fold hydrolase [Microbulbifer sp. EKSA005]|uniref:alpha/beta hydrolase family protein n=1 Tax=Microbulbifer sp. EKSA005 TaxID=3243364 RepID=UPI004042792E
MIEAQQIPTNDGVVLGARLFSPSEVPKAGIIINSAMAVKQSYYRDFACFLARNGYLVLTYDYRGIGKSSIENQRDKRLTLRAWGESDLAAVIDWCSKRTKSLEWHCICHSVGGQIVGLASNNTRFASVYCVSSQSGYWGHWDARYQPKLLFGWYCAFPLLSNVLGWVPGVLWGGENLPAGIAREWAYWARHKDYVVDQHGRPIREGFERMQCDMKFLLIDDDKDFAPEKAVRALRDFYSNANTDIEIIQTSSIGNTSIGHFGFFRKEFKESLWRNVLGWLD